jgi:hypothetical protein
MHPPCLIDEAAGIGFDIFVLGANCGSRQRWPDEEDAGESEQSSISVIADWLLSLVSSSEEERESPVITTDAGV